MEVARHHGERFRLLARLFAGGIGYPQGSCERFHGLSSVHFAGLLASELVLNGESDVTFIFGNVLEHQNSELRSVSGAPRFQTVTSYP